MFQAFELGPFIIWARLVFDLIGIWLAAEFLLRIAESANLSLQHFKQHSFWYVFAFLLTGRVLAVVAEYKVYLKEPLRMLILWDGGFSFLGGAIGIGIVLYVVTRGHRSIFLQWLDALVPAATLGLVFAWIGSFLAGDSYGKPTDMPWGVTYDAINVRYVIPVHPVQLYYAAFYFLLTFVLLVIRKRSKRVGAETLVGIISASLASFFLENFRGDFSIPIFATKVDFILLFALFLSLGIFAAVELKLSQKVFFVYECFLAVITGGYLLARPWLDLETYEFRMSQLLAVIALLGTVVYVVMERRKHPYF
jgi:phosphatidylglycerol:prolipoprotein diacylglycerol transferase